MSGASRSVIGSAVIPLRLLFFIWFVFAADYIYGARFSDYGIWPRTFKGLFGIFSAPLLHANFAHIISNTFPLLILGMVLFYFYPKIAGKVFFRSYFFTNILVWIFARPNDHVGASGLIYGLAAFLISFGLMRKDLYSLFISLVIIFFYGSMIYGILPVHTWISWESHLSGAIVGVAASYEFRNSKYLL
ncbi:MAG: rhomboid family intramembrane serine protease [Cyclobacteriaceae bacterium]|nr:rhomboid family intramembrane serine protease [Cyclobacteriaceae bacterium]